MVDDCHVSYDLGGKANTSMLVLYSKEDPRSIVEKLAGDDVRMLWIHYGNRTKEPFLDQETTMLIGIFLRLVRMNLLSRPCPHPRRQLEQSRPVQIPRRQLKPVVIKKKSKRVGTTTKARENSRKMAGSTSTKVKPKKVDITSKPKVMLKKKVRSVKRVCTAQTFEDLDFKTKK